MNRALVCVLLFVFGMFTPVIAFATTLINESSTFIRFGLPILTMLIAGHFSTEKRDRSFKNKAHLSWLAASLAIGLLIGVLATPGA